jgi:hypothetical protein
MNHRIITSDPALYYNKGLIRAPEKPSTSLVRLVIDSRERNATLFPNPNSYEINLIDTISGVKGMTLLSADIPFGNSYIVNSGNNVLYVAYTQTSPDIYAITIDTGDYTPTELASELTTAINTATGTTDFIVTYEAKKDIFKFRCTNSFGIIFRGKTIRHSYLSSTDTASIDRGMGILLGFGISNYISTQQSAGVNLIYSEFKINFDPSDCIVLNIDEFGVNLSTSDILNGSTAIITKSNIADLNKLSITKEFNPPLARLNKLKITLLDYYGNPYDFQNRNHRLEFTLICDG